MPFQTPPIHPTTGANTSNQVVVIQYTPTTQVRQIQNPALKYIILEWFDYYTR